MREARKLDVLLQSASELKKVSTSKAYAVAWMDPSVRVPSPAERNHGANPVWNTTMSVSLDERALGQGMSLTIELIGQGLVKTKRIGFVTVDISDIVLEGSKGASVLGQFHAYPVDSQIPFFLPFFLSSLLQAANLSGWNSLGPVKWNYENSFSILSISSVAHCKCFFKMVYGSCAWSIIVFLWMKVENFSLSALSHATNLSPNNSVLLWMKVEFRFISQFRTIMDIDLMFLSVAAGDKALRKATRNSQLRASLARVARPPCYTRAYT